MPEVVRLLFGSYVPVSDSSGVALSGLAGVNWEYVSSVLLFSICLVCFFKLLGVVLRKL